MQCSYDMQSRMKILVVLILVQVKMLLLVTGMSEVTQFDTLQCLPNFTVVNATSNLTAFQSLGINAYSSAQTLSPNYVLNCSGYVTAWGTFVGGVGIIEIEFQAWREGSPNEYWKVGGNWFEYELTGVDTETAIFEVDEQSMFRVEEGDIIGIYMGVEGNVSVQYLVNPNASMYVLFDATEPESNISIDNGFTGEVLGFAPAIGMLVEQRTGMTTIHGQPTVASHFPSPVTTSTSTPIPSIIVTMDTTLSTDIILAIVTAVVTATVILCLFTLLLCNKLRKFKEKKKRGSRGNKDSSVYEAVYSIPNNGEEIALKRNRSYSSSNVLNASVTSIGNDDDLSNPIELQDNMSYSSLVDSIDSATRIPKLQLQESHIYSQPAANSAHSDGISTSPSLQYYSLANDHQLGCGEGESDQIRIQDNLSYTATLTYRLESSCVHGNNPLDSDHVSHEYAVPDCDGDDESMQQKNDSGDGYLEVQ